MEARQVAWADSNNPCHKVEGHHYGVRNIVSRATAQTNNRTTSAVVQVCHGPGPTWWKSQWENVMRPNHVLNQPLACRYSALN